MRYCDKKFPDYAHRPGETIHPNQPGGHSHGQEEPTAIALDQSNFQSHTEFLYGFDLYNHEYFWEAHVYWEACWHSVGRRGDVADLLKSLILLSAGRLKATLGQPEPAMTHWKRSKELLEQIQHEHIFGLNLFDLVQDISSLSDKLDKEETLQHILRLDR